MTLRALTLLRAKQRTPHARGICFAASSKNEREGFGALLASRIDDDVGKSRPRLKRMTLGERVFRARRKQSDTR